MKLSTRHSVHWRGICIAFLATVFLLATGRGNELVWVPGRVFWDSSSPNWSRVSSPDDNLQWESGSDAIFGEETGIVFLGISQIDVSSLSFSETATIAGGSLNFTGSSRIDAGNNETVYIDSAISGSNGLLLGSRSEGAIIISGSNSFEGVTTVNSGTWLGVESDTALGRPGEGTVIRSGATLALGDVNITGEEITIAGNGTRSALGAIHQGGNIPRASLSGLITLSQDSKVGSAGQLDLDGPVNTNGEELTLSASPSGQIQVNGSILGSNLGEGNNVTFEGGGLVVLRNSNTYEGATLINGGTTLSVQAANGLPGLSGRSALIMDDLGEGGSSLLIGRESDQVVSFLDGSTTSSVILNSDLTVGHVGIGTPSNFQGVIEGNGSVIKDGINTQELSGPNIYDGDTTIRSGVLVVSNPSGLGSSVRGTAVETGATLILDDVSIADEAMVISGNGDIGQGALVGAGEEVSLSGPISLAGDSTIYGSTGTTLSLGGAVDRGENELEIRSDGTIDINGSLFGATNDRDPRLVFSGGGNVNLNTAGGSHGTIEITESVLVNANAFGSLSALGGPNPLVMNPNGVGGAQLNLAGNSQAVASIEGASTSQILLGGNNINVGFDPSTQAIGTQSADFGGSVKGVGEIHKTGLSNQILSGESDFDGLTYVHEGTLTIGHDMALGSALTPGSETRVSGEAGLALQGGIQTDERVLLFNNANLINNFGTNTISNLLLVEHDIDGPGVGDKLARIGALGGQLNLSGGIDDNAARFSSNPEMNLALNTGANDDGSIHIDSVIDSSIRDVIIGRRENQSSTSGSVILSGNNEYSGATYLSGGAVRLGVIGENGRAFGDSRINIANQSYLLGSNAGEGAQLLNTIDLSSESVLHTLGTLGLGGDLEGGGGLTVSSGTLTLFGNGSRTWGGDTIINQNGSLHTIDSEQISNASDLLVDGSVLLGGHETVGSLSGSGSILNDGHDLTITQTSNQIFSGDIVGSGAFYKEGEATLTLANGSGFDGAAHIRQGKLTISGPLETEMITVASGATLTTTGAELLSDRTTLINDGTLKLGGNETINNLLGSETGLVDLDSYNLILSGGIDFKGRINGSGSLTTGPGDIVLGGENSFTGELTVLSGSTTTLRGSTEGNVIVATGGELTLVSPERIADKSNLTVNGILNVNGTERVGDLLSSGLIRGSGLINADTYHLIDGGVIGEDVDLGQGVLKSDGTVLIGGNSFANTLTVQSGVMTLDGTLVHEPELFVNVNMEGTLSLGFDERIGDNAEVKIEGVLTLNGIEIVSSLQIKGGSSRLSGSGLLLAEDYNLSNGATTEQGANLGVGVLNSGPGLVTLGGDAAVGTANILSGQLNLNGQLTDVMELNLLEGAVLRNGEGERINDLAVINHAGTLTLAGDEKVATLNTIGGLLNGAGTLTAADYNLSNGATTEQGANLGVGGLNSGPGLVTLNGNTAASLIEVENGTLITNGEVQDSAGIVSVGSDSIWAVNGSYTYEVVEGGGIVVPGGANEGVFENKNTISPGNDIETLTISGDYVENGIYVAQLGLGSESDTLAIDGSTTLAAKSKLNLLEFGGLVRGSGSVLCGERWNVIDSSKGINGGWGEISDINNPGDLGQTIETQLLFDRSTGDLVSLGLGAGETVADYENISESQTSILSAVLNGATGDDLILGNYSSNDGGAGTVINSLYTVGEAGNKEALFTALDSLSPEIYGRTMDYALNATRTFTENTRVSRLLSSHRDAKDEVSRNRKPFEAFAGYSQFELSSSENLFGGDYHMRGGGIYAGGELLFSPNFTASSFLALDNGSVGSSSLDLDVSGLVIGASFYSSPLGRESPLRLQGTATHASYEFDGERNSFIGSYSVSSLEASAFELGLRAEYKVYEENGLQITPTLGLRHLSGTVEGFSEAGWAGALSVQDQKQVMALVDVGFSGSYRRPESRLEMQAELRWQKNLEEVERDIRASFTSSGSPLQVAAAGINTDALVYSMGFVYDINERSRLGLTYRGENRSETDPLQSLNLRLKVNF